MKKEGVSTLFIHSYLWALSCLLDHCFYLKMCFVVVFESIFEKRLRLGKLCNDSRLYKNAYKVLNFSKIFHVLKVFGVFEKMFVF